PGAAGAAGVGDQGPDPLAGGGDAPHRELDVTGGRVVPDQRDGEGAAFDVLALHALAGAPVDLLLVVLRVGGILGGIGFQAHGGGGADLLERRTVGGGLRRARPVGLRGLLAVGPWAGPGASREQQDRGGGAGGETGERTAGAGSMGHAEILS